MTHKGRRQAEKGTGRAYIRIFYLPINVTRARGGRHGEKRKRKRDTQTKTKKASTYVESTSATLGQGEEKG